MISSQEEFFQNLQNHKNVEIFISFFIDLEASLSTKNVGEISRVYETISENSNIEGWMNFLLQRYADMRIMDLIEADENTLVEEIQKNISMNLSVHLLFWKVEEKLFDILEKTQKLSQTDYSSFIDEFRYGDFGELLIAAYEHYIKYSKRPHKNKVFSKEEFEIIEYQLFWISDFILGIQQSRKPNVKYTPEMFAYTSKLIDEGFKKEKAYGKTLEKFHESTLYWDSYRRSYSKYMKK